MFSGTCIILKKSCTLTDSMLSEIGKRKPKSLSLIQCKGGHTSAHGLRDLFRNCENSIQVRGFLWRNITFRDIGNY